MGKPGTGQHVRTVNVCLTPVHEAFLRELQEQTGCVSASEQLRQAIELMRSLQGCEVYVRVGVGEELVRVLVPGLTAPARSRTACAFTSTRAQPVHVTPARTSLPLRP